MGANGGGGLYGGTGMARSALGGAAPGQGAGKSAPMQAQGPTGAASKPAMPQAQRPGGMGTPQVGARNPVVQPSPIASSYRPTAKGQ